MSQFALSPIDPDQTDGVELAANLEDFEAAVNSEHSGSARPAYVQVGGLWLDTSTSVWAWKRWDGTQDVIVMRFDTTNHRRLKPEDEVSVASAATCNVLGAASDFVSVTGSVTITSFGSQRNQVKYVRFTAAPTLTHNATTLILPTSTNIAVEAGDTCIVTSDSSGNARVIAYQRASGEALVTPEAAAAVPAGTKMLFMQAAVPAGWSLDVTHNDKGLRIVNTTGGGSGGNLNFSTVFAKTGVDATALTQAQLPNFNLNITGLTGSVNPAINNGSSVARNPNTDTNNQAGGGGNIVKTVSTSTLSLASGTVTFGGTIPSGGSGATHTHTNDIRVRYVDLIAGTKL